MQNPPTANYPGYPPSQGGSTPPFPAYPVPRPERPIPRTNVPALISSILSLFVMIGSFIVFVQIYGMMQDIHEFGIKFVYEGSRTVDGVFSPFLVVSFLALWTIALGRAGQLKAQITGGEGLVSASIGVTTGVLFFLGTFLLILMGIWLRG